MTIDKGGLVLVERDLSAELQAAADIIHGEGIEPDDAHHLIDLSLEDREALSEAVTEMFDPPGDYSEGEQTRLGYLCRSLGRETMNRTAFLRFATQSTKDTLQPGVFDAWGSRSRPAR